MIKDRATKNHFVDSSLTQKTHQEGDVAIIGGGPAGISAALTLSKTSPLYVFVIDHNNHPLQVGEMVHSSLKPVLKFLDIEHLFHDNRPVLSTGYTSTWGDGQLKERNALFNPFGQSYHLNRAQFNTDLLNRLRQKEQVTVFHSCKVISLDRKEKSFHLKLFDRLSERYLTLNVRFIIDSSGRQAPFAKQLSAQEYRMDDLVAISRFYTYDSVKESVTHSTLVESVEEGWWYSAVLPQSQLVTTFLCDKGHLQKNKSHHEEIWNLQLKKAYFTDQRVQANRGKIHGYKIQSAVSHYLHPAGGSGWVAAGDAACSFDPLSSMGIGHAMTSGICAGHIARRQLCDGKDDTALYSLDIQNNFKTYQRQWQHIYQQEQRWTASAFWKTRHSRMI